VQLEICNNGIEALKRLLLEHFDLVITHIEAPILNGIALVAALRLSESSRDICSILLTSKPVKVLHSDVDPDFVIHKDKDFNDNLSAIMPDIIANLKNNNSDN
jgi:CheY-like chemotaxis protein